MGCRRSWVPQRNTRAVGARYRAMPSIEQPRCQPPGAALASIQDDERHEVKSTSLWLDTNHPDQRSSLTHNARAEVCVIGAAIAGTTAAYPLAREGRRVLLLNHGTPGCGQTGVTTAHLSNVIDDRYTEIIRLHGVDGARLARESHAAAISRIETICREERIDADFERVSGYLFLSPEHDESYLDEEQDAAVRAGLHAEKLLRAPVSGFESGPCLHFADQGQFHPLKYLNGLLNAFVTHGGRVHG